MQTWTQEFTDIKMRLQNYLEETYKQDINFIKKRFLLYIKDIKHNIAVMRKSKIKDKKEANSLNKIYNELAKKVENIETTINNYKVDEMFEPDVMSKNVIRVQIQSIERNLQTLDDRLDKGFIDKKSIVNNLRSSLVSIWNKLQGIYKLIGRTK